MWLLVLFDFYTKSKIQQIWVGRKKRPDPRRLIPEHSRVSTVVRRLISGISVLKDIKKLNCSQLSCPGLNSGASITTVGQFSIFRLSRVNGGERNAENFQDFTKIKRPGSLPTPITKAAHSPHKVRFCVR